MKLLRSTDYKEYMLTDEDIQTIINYGKISFADENYIKKQVKICEEILFNHTGLILGYGKFKMENSSCEKYCKVTPLHNNKQIINVCVNDYFGNFNDYKTYTYYFDERKNCICIGQIYEAGMKENDLELLDSFFKMVGLKVSGLMCDYLKPISKYKVGII